MPKTKVAVIGAGVYGVAVLRQLSIERNFDLVCFERRSTTAGLWNYDDSPEVGPFVSPMYKHLRCNSPRALCEYPDKKIQSASSWPNHREVARYLKSYSKEHGLDEFIKFNTEVVNVSKLNESDVFIVKSRSLCCKSFTEEKYNAVVVAVGYNGRPVTPDIADQWEFGGEVFHSCTYRDPRNYSGKTVVLVGSNVSAWDIAWDLSPHVSEVLISHHDEPLLMTVPENGRAFRSGVKRFTPRGVVLENEQVIDCDVVIYCTGYTPYFPFLDKSCHTPVTHGRVEHLYKMISHTKVSSLFFTGLYNYCAEMAVAFCQAKLIAAVISGRAALPNNKVMERDAQRQMKEHKASGRRPRTFHNLAYCQRNYCKLLATMGEFKALPNVIHSIQERVLDLVHKERKYIMMRTMIHIEKISDDKFIEIRSSS